MAEFTLTRDIAAPPECVFDLWVNLERMSEWSGERVTDLVGVAGETGTHCFVGYGRWRAPVEVIDGRRPTTYAFRVSWGPVTAEFRAEFAAIPGGTRLTQILRTRGPLAWIWARILATGSYAGSFRGEMATFARIAERECEAP